MKTMTNYVMIAGNWAEIQAM